MLPSERPRWCCSSWPWRRSGSAPEAKEGGDGFKIFLAGPHFVASIPDGCQGPGPAARRCAGDTPRAAPVPIRRVALRQDLPDAAAPPRGRSARLAPRAPRRSSAARRSADRPACPAPTSPLPSSSSSSATSRLGKGTERLTERLLAEAIGPVERPEDAGMRGLEPQRGQPVREAARGMSH